MIRLTLQDWEAARRDLAHQDNAIARRLVPLALPGGTHRLGLRIGAQIQAKGKARRDPAANRIESDSRRLRLLASTATPNRMGDTVAQDSWNLENYEANPVVLINHRYSVETIVGHSPAQEVTKAGLEMDVELDPLDQNDVAALVAARLNAGSLNTVSVGFIPHRIERNEDEEGEWDGTFTFHDNELLEVSFVAIPANPEATVLELETDPPPVDPAAALEAELETVIGTALEYSRIQTLLNP